MHQQKIRQLFLVIFTIFLSGIVSFQVMAEEPSLDDVIGGFDEPATSAPDPSSDDTLTSDDDLNGILDGFGDDDKEDSTPLPESSETDGKGWKEAVSRYFSVNGHIKLGLTYNYAHDAPEPGRTDWRGLSRLKPELQLEVAFKPYRSWDVFVSGKGYHDFAYWINGRDNYTSYVLDNYEQEIELKEAYVLGKVTQKIDIKLGRQIVVWGKSDNIRVTDVLNPLYLREPGMTDIEDIRMPVTMSKVDYYFGNWRLSGMAIHEIRFNKLPEYGSDFYPLTRIAPHEEIPESQISNTEYAISLNGIFSGWDIAFYFADYFDDYYHISFESTGFVLSHTPLTLVGTAFNIAKGNWLFKSEAAHIQGFQFYNAAGMENTYSRIDLLAGVEYYGLKNTPIGFEAVNRHMMGYDAFLFREPGNAEENSFQTALRATRTFMNETLSVTFLASTFGPLGQGGSLQRLSAEYDITDTLKTTVGIMLYNSGDRPELKQVGDNDRVYADIKYSF